MPFPILIAVSADRQTDRDISILQYYAVTGSGRQSGKQSKAKQKERKSGRELEKKESKQIVCDKWLIMLLVLGDWEM